MVLFSLDAVLCFFMCVFFLQPGVKSVAAASTAESDSSSSDSDDSGDGSSKGKDLSDVSYAMPRHAFLPRFLLLPPRCMSSHHSPSLSTSLLPHLMSPAQPLPTAPLTREVAVVVVRDPVAMPGPIRQKGGAMPHSPS